MSILSTDISETNRQVVDAITKHHEPLLNFLYRYTAWKYVINIIRTVKLGDGRNFDYNRSVLLSRSYHIMTTDKYYRRFEVESNPPRLIDTFEIPNGDILRMTRSSEYRSAINTHHCDQMAGYDKLFDSKKDSLVKELIIVFSDMKIFDCNILENHYKVVCEYLSSMGTDINRFPKFDKEKVKDLYF